MFIMQYPIIVTLICATVVISMFLLRKDKRLEVILLLLMLTMLALPRAGIFVPQVRLPLPLAHILTALLIPVWLLRLHRKYQNDRVNFFFLIYAIIACWGIGLGIATGGSVLYAFLEASFYFFVIGLFFYVCDTYDQKRHFDFFIRGFLIISLAVSLYGIAQSRYGDSILVNRITYNSATNKAQSYIEHDYESRRVLSSYGDPNVLASQLVLFAGVALSICLSAGNIASKDRLFWLLAFCLNIVCLYYTGSRAGLIAFLFVVTIILTLRTRWLLMLALAVIIYFIMLDVIDIAGLASFLPEDDVRRQFPIWAVQFIKGVPLGCGFGNSVSVDFHEGLINFSVIPATTIWMGFNSFWLDLLSRIGLPGAIAFMLLLAALFYRMAVNIRKIHDPYVKAALLGGILGLAAQTLIWCANNTYILPGGGLSFWFMMGMFYAGANAYAKQECPIWAVPQDRPWQFVPLAYTR